MDLATAIRAGAKLRRQHVLFPTAFWISARGEISSCVLGAAYEGLTGRSNTASTDVYMALRQAFPILANRIKRPCPVDPQCHRGHLLDRLYHLNDHHRWTREQIADWIETL